MKSTITKRRLILEIIAVILIVALGASTVFLYFRGRNLREQLNTEARTYSPAYVKLTSLTVKRFLKMMENGDEFLVAIGRTTCGDCRVFEPTFLELVEELDMNEQIYYLNLAVVRSNSSDEDWNSFKERIGIMYTPTYARYAGGEITSMIEWDEDGLTEEQVKTWLEEQKGSLPAE